ncbi:dTDP-4-keto-6-deoxy-D-glucose epimerase [Streptomyces sp. ICN441]|uniref:dTDP-4-keto-6-deoxy-D-glucose epimerase n=2 Tax=Streptomyces TaxID=1883 RepID=A0A2S1T0N4_9ACTN|nr:MULTISPECIES: dTDP-4-dehydrorhamnose 3,5-epimerase family protein [Streptomyces]ATJ00760.1 dTDP-4-dehydrorhamnose 3,5-epimerase [Streptomyces sp. SCSIO 1666]AWI32181.1 dTDP-4-keto-6-deoxy-D-glucose epimerase [Streptomyces tirandamycinicus]MCY0979864.1 dTDP-4-dehydrorhamnose 3,5-epimerase family protein [Streptomyces tirandamycinicus]NNJ05116.1 dTDP-4-keto-6-deoxy-D-glucose epimerase [Streptomyces sp. PKU-MA01144]TFE36344.1 dTDP-4-keto-6-deoxy-D-glucose epimerase [Streptomyces sp. ICN441]
MQFRQLKVEGAYEFTPRQFRDHRGLFVSPFQLEAFQQALGRPHFPVAQTNHSISRRGTVRGIHFTVTPPGTAKYVYCARGRALDIVVDLRVGSPTFRQWDAVEMDQVHFRSSYFPVGVGHAFVALEDDTVMSYLLTGPYVAEHELAVDVFDEDLDLRIPAGPDLVQSDRDRAAPSFAAARAQGLLPGYAESAAAEESLWRPSGIGAPS